MKLKLLTTFLLMIFLQTSGLGQTCVTNLIKNGDFSTGDGSNWTKATTKGTGVEIRSEDTYFTTSNGNFTAELDNLASLQQTVNVNVNVQYKISFLFAQRTGASQNTGVKVRITEGSDAKGKLILLKDFSTSGTVAKTEFLLFAATSSTITIEFYNDFVGTATIGTIIDDIVLVPSTQVVPVAITNPAGIFHTTTTCEGVAVQLDVVNVPASGVTYLWTGPTGAVFSNPNIKNPIVSFASGGLKDVIVTTTDAKGCKGSSITYVNVSVTTAPVAKDETVIECFAATLKWNTISNATGYYIDIATDALFTNFVGKYQNFEVSTVNSETVSSLPGGAFYYRIRAKYSCGGKVAVTANSNTINFTTKAPALVVSSAQTICYDSRPSSLQLTGSYGSVVRWESCSNNSFKETDPSFTKYIGTKAQAILNADIIANLRQNTYFRVRVKQNTGDCVGQEGYSAPVLITVSSQELAPTIVNVIQPTCVNSKASVELGNLPPYGSIYQTGGGISDKFHILTGGVTQTIVGLDAGTYSFSIKSGSILQCSTKATADVVITAPITKTWNGNTNNDWNTETNWTPHGVPAVSNCVVIPLTSKNPIISGTNGTFYANTLKINDKASLVVDSTNTLKVEDIITIDNLTGKTASLTFENKASLVQVNDVQNVGDIVYKRNTLKVRKQDYTYWSSPVEGMTMKKLSSNTASGKYMGYANGAWVISKDGSAIMDAGLGYSIRGPEAYPVDIGIPFEAVFVGRPRNGGISAPLKGTWNLLGNPYPSAISADKFLRENTSLYGTLYFWTHNSLPSSAVSGNYDKNYTSSDYATYNLTGAINTGTGSNANTVGNNAVPTGLIGSGQGFMVAAISGAVNAVFTNDMRLSEDNKNLSNGQFFKMTKSSSTEKNRVWLNLTNDQGLFKQILIGYVAGATNNYDRLYDGISFNANSFADFYSTYNTSKLTIQGRALPFLDTDEVALGYMVKLDKGIGVANEFKISIDHADGSLENQPVYVLDKVTNSTYDLRKGAYVFTSLDGAFNNRFVLKYAANTLGVDEVNVEEVSTQVSVSDNVIKITTHSDAIIKVAVYDLSGKMLFLKNDLDASVVNIENIGAHNQVLLVKIVLRNGANLTKKIIVR